MPTAIVPTQLSVDCASRRNFEAFRKNSAYMGLAGVVNLSAVRGRWGTYNAGNLFLFPWLKPKGLALGGGKVWNAYCPTNATQAMASSPIRGATLPQDEYFCRFVLQAPLNQFIGFSVDVPHEDFRPHMTWLSNVDKLTDGQGIGIDWTSCNLNDPWFAGSRWIPSTEQCQGSAWRKVIVDGLNRASATVC